jgi:hypothetical protein
MKKLLLLPSLLAAGMMFAQSTYVAPWQDISAFSTSNQQGGQQIIVDPATGNVFTVGDFEGAISIGSFNLTSTGNRDIYVAKYNSSGTVLKAVKLGSAAFDEAYTICYRDNYVFVGARVNGNGTIYKLDDDATPLDVSITRDLGYDVRPRSLFVYGSGGKMLVGGSFVGSCTLTKASGTIELEANNYYSEECTSGCFQSFTGIIDMSAYFSFAVQPTQTTGSNEIMSIWCRNGYIYCTGYFRDTMKWASGSTAVKSAGVQDLFIASVYISTSINTMTYFNDLIQAGSIESTPGSGSGDPYWKECGYGICANGTAVYVTGNLNSASTPLFDGSSFTGAGAFVARINYSGSTLGAVSWVRASEDCASGTAVMESIGYGIAADALGNVWATGRCEDDVQFQGGSNADICVWTPAGRPGFIARYDASGNILSADAINQATVASSVCEGRSFTTNGCEVFTTGYGQEYTFQAGNLPAQTIGSANMAMYVFEIGRDATVANNITFCTSCASFPINLSLSSSGGTSYSWSPGTYLSSTSVASPSFSMSSCSQSDTLIYTDTIRNTTTGCDITATVTVIAGSSAVGVANAGPDVVVCPNTNYTLGTNMPDGLTYFWSPNGFLTNWTTDQPTYYNVAALTFSPTNVTLQVKDVCGNISYDNMNLTNNPACPRRMSNPNQPHADVFPNPSNGVFTVNLSVAEQEEHVELVVTDLSGRVVKQTTVTTAGGPVTLDLSGEAAGVYMLSVTRGGETEVHKLTIE